MTPPLHLQTTMSPRRDAVISGVLFLAVLIVHMNGVYTRVNDTRWYIPTAMSIIKEGDTDLDEYRGIISGKHYAIQSVDGHLYNLFPVGPALVAVPFVYVVDQLSTNVLLFDLQAHMKKSSPAGVEMFVASCLTSLTAVLVYLIGRLFLDKKRSLILVFLFACCTSSWSEASRALWQHGPSMLMLSASLYLLLLARDKPRLVQWVAVPLFFSYLVRPTNAISIVAISLYVLARYRRYMLTYGLFASVTMACFLVHNYRIYGNILPPYYSGGRVGLHGGFVQALAGNLISPSRGLIVFTPVFLFSVYGMCLRIRARDREMLDYVLPGIIVVHWLSISSFGHWWGGHSFGPRFFSDIIPYFVYYLIPVLEKMSRATGVAKVALGVSFSICITVTFFVHFRGATEADVRLWNRYPVDVDKKPSRLWDWQDVSFLRGIQVAEPVRVPLSRWSAWLVPNKSDFTFGGMMDLKGWRLLVDRRSVRLTVYWQARERPDFDYSAFVHVVDSSGKKVAQRDHAPGACAGYPPTKWQPGDVIADEHSILIPHEAPEGTYRLKVGVYNWATGQRLEVYSHEKRLGDSIILEETFCQPPPLPHRFYLPLVPDGQFP